MRISPARFLAAIAIIALSGSLAQARAYRNNVYGYRLVAPDNLRLCTRANSHYEGVEHGPEIVLDPKDKTRCDDDALFRRRLISFYAGYNVFDDTKTFEAYVAHECSDVLGGHCAAGPPGLHIAEFKSATLRADRNGAIDVAVLALRGSDPDVGYAVNLHTDAAHFEQDLKIFRTVLNSLRLPH